MYAIAGLEDGGGDASKKRKKEQAAAPPCAPPKASSSSWQTAAARKMAPSVLSKKAAAPAAPMVPRSQSSRPRASDAAAGGASSGADDAAEATGAGGWYKDIRQMYDPAQPNDYDDWLREAELRRKQREVDEQLQRKLAAADDERAAAESRAKQQRTAPPPPPPPPPPPLPSGFAAAGETGDPGLAMLQNMGWSEGQGLGRDGQGMTTPLVARKTDATTAVIVNAEQRPRPPPPPPPPPPPGAAAAAGGEAPKKGAVTFRGRPSRVLLLRNMVGPGEVDGELSAEIGEECSKYGEVAAVHVYEVPHTSGGAVAPEEAVRIFVKFGKQAAAMKAYIDLDGRFFGGRQVGVAFFKEDDFDKQNWAPS